MAHHFLVLHFGVQCSWQPWVAIQAREAAKSLKGRADIVDVTQRQDLAEHYRLFFPFMTVINGITHLPSPTRAEELVRIAIEGFVPPYLAPTLKQAEAHVGTIMPLIAANFGDTCRLCIPLEEKRGCLLKMAWATRIAPCVPGGILGFFTYDDGQVVGAVEFLPATLVPYPLPEKTTEIAFITCLYSLENEMDYRGQVLQHLVEHLRGTAYKEVQVITGKYLPYPNGPEAFFHQYGFHRVCELGSVTLREGEEELILLRLKIGDER